MNALACARCGAPLPNGSVRYVTEVVITADFDPILALPDDLDGEIERTLDAVEKAADQGLAGELEEQVMARRAFLLCPTCREVFLGGLPGRLQ